MKTAPVKVSFGEDSPGPFSMWGSGEIGKRAGLGSRWESVSSGVLPCGFKARLPYHFQFWDNALGSSNMMLMLKFASHRLLLRKP